MAIPTNLITGFLGTGKTTAILDLLRRRPSGEHWGILVNEYGEVPIDPAVLSSSGTENVTVSEVSGGCVCCTTAPYLQVALHMLMVDRTPDRVIIETTGLGHPARLLDTLRQFYADQLEIRAILCLVDPGDFADPAIRDNPVFRDQIQLADVLVLNKLDVTSPEVVENFRTWAEELYPPKQLIVGTQQGRLEMAWLNLGADSGRTALFPETHLDEPAAESLLTPEFARPGKPIRRESPGGVSSCGWIFHAKDVFQEERLLQLLGGTPQLQRLKGVFQTTDGWVLIQRVGKRLTMEPCLWRRDSRLEVFAEELPGGWQGFEAELVKCLEKGL